MHTGLIATLFDFSFRTLVTTKLIKLLYALSMALIALVALGLVALAFSAGAVAGVITLVVLAPVAALVWLVYVRVALELLIALLRIMENTQELVVQGGHLAPGDGDDRLAATR